MLAYVFWHRPAAGVDAGVYERALRDFHRRLAHVSASYRLGALPFDADPGYEDWYVVDDWAALGELAASAVDGERRSAHDGAASIAGPGWGGVYGLVRGDGVPPAGCRWVDKPRGEPSQAFLRALDSPQVWRRELVLGPAPEFCLAAPAEHGRVAIAAPAR